MGATKILSRYRDEQVKAILSPDGLLYVPFNGAISTFALILIFRFENSVPALTVFKGNSLTAAIAAGFGSTAITRTRIAVIKGTDNKDVSIGPDIVINLLLSMMIAESTGGVRRVVKRSLLPTFPSSRPWGR